MAQKQDRAQRAAETSEQMSKKAKEERLCAAQSVSERRAHATSQSNSTRKRGAETPKEREMSNGSSEIRHFKRSDEDVTE